MFGYFTYDLELLYEGWPIQYDYESCDNFTRMLHVITFMSC